MDNRDHRANDDNGLDDANGNKPFEHFGFPLCGSGASADDENVFAIADNLSRHSARSLSGSWLSLRPVGGARGGGWGAAEVWQSGLLSPCQRPEAS
jgi:hypothetical protein